VPEGNRRRLHPFTPLLRGWKIFAAVVVILGRQVYSDVTLGWDLLAIGIAVPVAVAYGFLSWRFTYYEVSAEELHLETGVLFRRSRHLRLDRLQAVDVVRPLVGRALGLAELRLEVAGGSSAEAPLAYLGEARASALRAELLARAAGIAHDAPEAPETVLFTVPLRHLVQAALRSSGLIVNAALFLVLLVVGFGFGQWAALGVALPTLLVTIPVMARPVISHFEFTLADSPDGLRLRHGLLETRSQTVPPGRIQAVRIIEPWLWRTKGWCKVEVNVAGYAGEGQDKVSVLLPVAPKAQALALLGRVLPDLDLGAPPVHPAPARARWVDPVAWRFLAAGVDDRFFVAQRGRFQRETDIVPHEKVQSVRLSQGWLQRRLALATLHVDTTPGPVQASAGHRDAGASRALLDRETGLARAARARAAPEQWMRHSSRDREGSVD
jgi:putative membrane protein